MEKIKKQKRMAPKFGAFFLFFFFFLNDLDKFGEMTKFNHQNISRAKFTPHVVVYEIKEGINNGACQTGASTGTEGAFNFGALDGMEEMSLSFCMF